MSTPRPQRFMWLLPERLLYVGLLGAPTLRTMGSVNVYVAHEGRLRVRIGSEGEWQSGELAVVPPYVPHQVQADARLIKGVQVEAESVDLARLPLLLQACGVVQDPAFVARVRAVAQPESSSLTFDETFFGAALAPRLLDPRIRAVVEAIRGDPSVPLSAEDCARAAQLSFSRFLHLFKRDVGAPFRAFRTWKRARSLLQHVNREANLAHLALDTGYPDSTHFSHSIRQIYGLTPRDIFAGSRRLAIYAG